MNKPETFASRLQQLLDMKSLTRAELSRRTGISRSSITHYIKGDWEGKQDAVYSIAAATGVNEAWLMGYDVPMYKLERLLLSKLKKDLAQLVKESPTISSDKRLRFLFDALEYDPEIIAFNLDFDQSYIDNWLRDGDLPPRPIIDKILGILQMQAAELLNDNELASYEAESVEWGIPTTNLLSLPVNKSYPLLGDIACGTPILAEENISEYIQFPGNLNADYCLRCHGDSMIDARIHDGDIVFIRQQSEVENGEIAAILIGEEATLKRVYFDNNTLTLMAANPAYPPKIYTGEQLSDVRILGKAVYFLSMVK